MAGMRMSMRKIREVLRLTHKLGLSVRQVREATGVGKTAVCEYVRRAKVVGITWPIPAEISDAELDEWLFAECSDAQHASGTCRMGAPDDTRSVVDPECRVIGCTGLRVIDASIMPEVPRANTHLTTVAIAERMADRLRNAQ